MQFEILSLSNWSPLTSHFVWEYVSIFMEPWHIALGLLLIWLTLSCPNLDHEFKTKVSILPSYKLSCWDEMEISCPYLELQYIMLTFGLRDFDTLNDKKNPCILSFSISTFTFGMTSFLALSFTSMVYNIVGNFYFLFFSKKKWLGEGQVYVIWTNVGWILNINSKST